MSTNILQMRTRRGVELRNTVPADELIRAFGACQWWLTKPWLTDSSGIHPMQLLWRETGWTSDVECYLIGQAIYQLHKNGTKRDALEAKRVEFLGKQAGNQRGYLFELLTALLLLAGGNEVQLLEASAKGYDLDVRTPNGHDIQVSCKVVQHSELHKKFTDDAAKSRESLLRAMQTARKQGITAIYEGNSYNAGVVPTDTWVQCLAPLTSSGQATTMAGPAWTIFTGRDQPVQGTLGFSKRFLSYTFLASAKMDIRTEVKRVLAKVGKANKKFKKHAPQGKINLTAIRIPEYITLDDVENAVLREFNNGRFTNTSAILLLQSSIAKMDAGRGPLVHLVSYRMVQNQQALVPFPADFHLHLVLPIGAISDATPEISIGNVTVKSNEYMYMDKVEHVVVPIDSTQQGSGIPGVRRFIEWEGIGGAIEMPMIPMDFRLL